MSDKRIVSFDVYEVPTPTPESKYEMSFKTADGWFYTYVALTEDGPFSFKHKRRPDMEISEDDVTPQSIRDYIGRRSELELVNAKVIYHGEYPGAE